MTRPESSAAQVLRWVGLGPKKPGEEFAFWLDPAQRGFSARRASSIRRTCTKNTTRQSKTNLMFQPFGIAAIPVMELTAARAPKIRMPSSWIPASARRQRLCFGPQAGPSSKSLSSVQSPNSVSTFVSTFRSMRHYLFTSRCGPAPTPALTLEARALGLFHAAHLAFWPLRHTHPAARLTRVRLIHVSVPLGVFSSVRPATIRSSALTSSHVCLGVVAARGEQRYNVRQWPHAATLRVFRGEVRALGLHRPSMGSHVSPCTRGSSGQSSLQVLSGFPG